MGKKKNQIKQTFLGRSWPMCSPKTTQGQEFVAFSQAHKFFAFIYIEDLFVKDVEFGRK